MKNPFLNAPYMLRQYGLLLQIIGHLLKTIDAKNLTNEQAEELSMAMALHEQFMRNKIDATQEGAVH